MFCNYYISNWIDILIKNLKDEYFVDGNKIGVLTPNFLKPNDSNDIISEQNDKNENYGDEENDVDTFDIDSSVGTEISQRGNISIPCISNMIKIPKEFHKNKLKDLNNRNKNRKYDYNRKKSSPGKYSKPKDTYDNKKKSEKSLNNPDVKIKSEKIYSVFGYRFLYFSIIVI